ncbi:gamma-glutamylcyclotransferase family protein [Paenibacillus alkaliterrae]|uniref:gamma-glutamylcyclotransferase family protein n=1 Tax=Paenibacillus alkaliterrae TaxID=320909 RepID=UPI002E239EB0
MRQRERKLVHGDCRKIIRGQWIAVDREGLAVMDRLEEFYGIEEQNDYERIWVGDIENGSPSGWVYVWATDRGCPEIPGDYWPDYRAAK